MAGEKDRVDSYLNAVGLLEPDLCSVDNSAALTSIAISLKRIADALQTTNEYGEYGSQALAGAILRELKAR